MLLSKETQSELKTLYSEPHRFYHNNDHIDYCDKAFRRLQKLYTGNDSLHPWTITKVEGMILFHDAIYNVGPNVVSGQNEEDSAVFFESSQEYFSYAGEISIEIARGIRFSANHTTTLPKSELTDAIKIFLDIDLCSMGGSYKSFLNNGDNIVKEYSWLDLPTLMKGRRAFFEALLSRPYIYYNHVMRGMYEEKTRKNINRWLNENET
jgi:predicted metal-dependent HD superfamily phosphohydrolase